MTDDYKKKSNMGGNGECWVWEWHKQVEQGCVESIRHQHSIPSAHGISMLAVLFIYP